MHIVYTLKLIYFPSIIIRDLTILNRIHNFFIGVFIDFNKADMQKTPGIILAQKSKSFLNWSLQP